MRRRTWGLPLIAALLVALSVPLSDVRAELNTTRAALPLRDLFDNQGISTDDDPAAADLDGKGASLSAEALAGAGWTPGRALTLLGAPLTWPATAPGTPDNVRADGQTVRLDGRGDALAFLVTATAGHTVQGDGSVTYADGSRSAYRLGVPDWRRGTLATKALALPRLNTATGPRAERASLYAVTVPLNPGRAVTSVRLPDADGLHVFALAVRPEAGAWTGSWGTAQSGLPAVGPWHGRTLRLVVHTSAGGPRVRLRFDNAFAAVPVRIGAATVAVRASGATARSTPVPVTFDGAPRADVPAGAQAVSDPLAFTVPPGADLLVSFHLPDTVRALPAHRLASQLSYLSGDGDHTADASGAPYTRTLTSWPLLAGVDVGARPGTVVVLGDSITDGYRSTPGADRRWPDLLTARLRAGAGYGVVNAGIASNRVLEGGYAGDGVSSVQSGVAAVDRLERDVFAWPSVRALVVLEGVNDLRHGASAAEVTAGLREIAERARARGLRVLGGTLLPCAGERMCTDAVRAEREKVNAWVRNGGAFDAVADFDRALRDPAAPERLRPAYDSGDHLHPGDAGYAAMAAAVDLTAL